MGDFKKAAVMLGRLREIARAEKLMVADELLVDLADKHADDMRNALLALDEALTHPHCVECGERDPLGLYMNLGDRSVRCAEHLG